MLTQYIARPLARVIGWPMARIGLAGRLGQENAMRNPSRTAQTAAALTIGVALVTGVTVFAASLQETFIGTLDKRVRADLVIFSSTQQPFSPAAAASAGGRPHARRRHRLARRRVQGLAGESTQGVSGIDPSTLDRRLRSGRDRRVDDRAVAAGHDRRPGGLRQGPRPDGRLADAGALRQDREHDAPGRARSSPTTRSASSSSRCPSTSATSPPSRTP